MKGASLRQRTAEAPRASGRPGPSRARHRLRSAAESGVLAALLLAVVAAAVVGSHALLLLAVGCAWPVLAAIVGVRNVLDAGCAFMLVAVGVILVVDLASNGPAALLP